MSNILYEVLLEPHLNNDKVFLVHDDNSQTTYREFLELASTLAHQLSEIGIQPDDKLIVKASKSKYSLALYAASILTGSVYIPLNTSFTLVETEYFIKDAKPLFIICDDNSAKELEEISSSVDAKFLILNDDGSGSLTKDLDLFPNYFKAVDRNANDLVSLLYTSGTTGQSKGAMLTQENLLTNSQSLCLLWEIKEKDILIHALPIYHTHGLFVAVNTSLLSGATIRFIKNFNLDLIIEAIPSSTILMGVPTFYTRLLKDNRLNSELTKNMRLFISGSAPLRAETHKEFEKITGHQILERYGMTETNMNSSNPYNGIRKPGTVGLPLNDIDIIITNPDTGDILNQGEVGMIEIKGPNIFKGYFNMPEKTKKEFRPNGYFITGDMGMFDEDGYLTIVGREKDLIISGGYNIYPKEIEDTINEVGEVLECAVVGVPNEDLGEVPIAVIVTSSRKKEEDLENIKKNIQLKLAKFKNPHSYFFINELPRNTMGKVQKNKLRNDYS